MDGFESVTFVLGDLAKGSEGDIARPRNDNVVKQPNAEDPAGLLDPAR